MADCANAQPLYPQLDMPVVIDKLILIRLIRKHGYKYVNVNNYEF
jgi:hypothetical protein